MQFRVSVPSDVPHPDIKPSVGKEIGETLIGQVGEPVGAGAEETVLQEEHWTLCKREGGDCTL